MGFLYGDSLTKQSTDQFFQTTKSYEMLYINHWKVRYKKYVLQIILVVECLIQTGFYWQVFSN